MNKKTPIDAKALREKIEGLYKDADLTQDDKKILRNDRISISMQEHRDSQTNEDKQEFSSTMSLTATKRNQNPKYLKNLHTGIANRDNTYQAEANARPAVKAKISKALAGKPKTKAHKEALKSTTTNRYGNANYEAAHKAGLAKRDTPFWAGEYSIMNNKQSFPSIAEAARWVEENKLLKNAYKKFSKWKTEKPEEYYFLDKKNG
jgi:hypothetical protein